MFALFTKASLLFVILLTSSVVAEETRWYQVEVILFAHHSEAFQNSERWSYDQRLPDRSKAINLRDSGQENNRPIPFSRITHEAMQLRDEAARIQADNQLGLLLHTGWYQPGLAAEEATGVKVHVMAPNTRYDTARPRLEGVLTLSLSRFLHMQADLLYRDDVSIPAGWEGMFSTSGFTYREDEYALLPQGQFYRLLESRRMRSNELHYLDHPVFGMLVLVTQL